MRVFGFAGWKHSGKSELMCRLLPALIARGVSVSAIKEAPHDYDVDKPGKDSFQHRLAGAEEVMLASSHRWALMRERRGVDSMPCLAEILDRMTPVDLVLIDGFRQEPHAKLEVRRAADRQPLLAAGDPTIVAVASDRLQDGLAVPQLDLADTAAIADFILRHCGLHEHHGRAASVAMRRGQAGGRD